MGRYKLTIFPASELSDKAMEKEFKFKVEMDAAKDACAELLLMLQGDLKVMHDYSNIFIEKMWCEDTESWSEFI